MQNDTNELQDISLEAEGAVSESSHEALAVDEAMAASTASDSPDADSRWRVAIIQHDGLAMLHVIDVSGHASGEEVMRKLVDNFGVTGLRKFLHKMFLFHEQEVRTGDISVITTSGLEAQNGPLLVNVSNTQAESFLTRAFHDPRQMGLADDFAAANARFATSTQLADPRLPVQAIVMSWKTTKTQLIWCVLLLSVLSLAIGVLVGKLANNAELGVAVTSGVAAILSCIEMLMVWQFK